MVGFVRSAAAAPLGSVVLAGVLTAGAVAGAGAQAVCSAPHSSPVLAQGGTIQTLPPGAGWAQVSAYRQVSGQFFNTGGDRQDFLADGRVQTHSAFFTGSVGVARGVDAWLQVPVHDVRYTDQSGERRRFGLGDPRASLRIGPALVGATGVPLALRAGVKLAGTQFPVDATVIPLGDGQRDWELSLESGKAIGFTTTGYVLGWVGYRWRELNERTGRKPGNEVFTHLAVGGRWRSLHAELGLELLFGGTPTQGGLELPGTRRRLGQLQPTVGYQLGRGAIEFTALLPLTGRNLPSGSGGSVGYRFSWGGP